jgi:hypothetical protein
MKLKDIKLMKQKSQEELKALLPGLTRDLRQAKLDKKPTKDIKYQIAVVKTICNS